MFYNNSFNFLIKTLGKEFPINIFQLNRRIECNYKLLEYSKNMRYIDIDLKTAMKHFFIQSQVEYINSICNQKSLTVNDLGFFSNMLVMKSLTSASSINLLNVDSEKIEKVNSTFFADKKICGILSNQYLSPITTFVFKEEWLKLTELLKYEKVLNYEKTFLLNLNEDASAIAEAIWEKKLYSDNYNDKNSFLSSFKQLLESQYWIHNFGDFKLYKSPGNFYFYPEIFQILYNIEFKFNDELKKFEILFDSLFFDKSLLGTVDVSNYKNFNEFESALNDWRGKSDVLTFKDNCSFAIFLKEKYILDDYNKEDLNYAILKTFENSKNLNCTCLLVLIKKSNLNKLKLKPYLSKKNISFFYYIPYSETKNKKYDLIWICVKNDFYLDVYNLFLKYKVFSEQSEIIKYIIDEINWINTDLYKHYLWWNINDQELISSFIDFVCGGLVVALPITWNK